MVCLAFLGNARRTGAFFATFFLFVFVFLTVVAFLRAAALVTGVFLRAVLPLAFFLVAIETSLDAHWILKPLPGSLPNKKLSCRSC